MATNELFTVGTVLANGATVTSDTFTTVGAAGQTLETVIDSAGNTFTINGNAAGNANANQSVITSKVLANLATLETFITNNPNGAVLTAGQTNVLARMIAALTRLVLSDFNSVGGS